MPAKKGSESSPKNKRNMFSFEADEDVARMIERTKMRGIKFVHTCNAALRPYLLKNGFGGKKDSN